MWWLARDRRHKAPADEIAQNLFQIMVEQQSESDGPEQFHLPTAISREFRAKMRLYREALVLMVLLSQAQREPEYEEVLKSYERIILPSTPTPHGVAKLEALKAAMQHIRELINPHDKRKEISWSMAWLNEIGPETNPATLVLLAAHWMDSYIALADSLKRLRPA